VFLFLPHKPQSRFSNPHLSAEQPLKSADHRQWQIFVHGQESFALFAWMRRSTSIHEKGDCSMRFIAGVLFIFVFPYLLWKFAVAYAVPFFGITHHASIAAVAMIAIPAGISLFIGGICASGMRLPDN
jgi:hypothetical protein